MTSFFSERKHFVQMRPSSSHPTSAEVSMLPSKQLESGRRRSGNFSTQSFALRGLFSSHLRTSKFSSADNPALETADATLAFLMNILTETAAVIVLLDSCRWRHLQVHASFEDFCSFSETEEKNSSNAKRRQLK